MMRIDLHTPIDSRKGFTLLELVIVLGILSVLTMLLTRSFTEKQHELRVERSNRLLETLDRAIAGDRWGNGGLNGSNPCVVGEMGRLPRAVTNVADETILTLAELVRQPEAAAPFGVYPAVPFCRAAQAQGIVPLPMDERVFVPMGWRGPYLQLPPGMREPFVYDGWGNAMVSQNTSLAGLPDPDAGLLPSRLLAETWADDETDSPSAQTATNGMPIAFIRHLGANGLSSRTEGIETGFDRDVVIAPVSNAFTDVVSGYLRFAASATGAVVRIYGPPPAVTDDVDARRPMVWEWRQTGVWEAGEVIPFTISNRLERMTAGLRMLRASAFGNGSDTQYSIPIQLILTPGTTVVPQTLSLEQRTP